MRRSSVHQAIRSAFALACIGMSSVAAADDVIGFAENAVRDSIDVNGAKFVYLADVSIDTTEGGEFKAFSDWWIGMGWDARQKLQMVEGPLSTLDLVSSRPQLMLERHLTSKSMRSRLGWSVAYSQPWSLMQDGVMDDVKGWLFEPGKGQAFSILQVVLRPDSLFPEPDTLLAPLAIGHAIRVGGFWEGEARFGWYPRVGLSLDLWRPKGWVLRQPDPTFGSWEAVVASDTYDVEPRWNGRWRVEAGGTLDMGKRHSGVRAATQCRLLAFWVPGRHWGVNLSLAVSPTRR